MCGLYRYRVQLLFEIDAGSEIYLRQFAGEQNKTATKKTKQQTKITGTTLTKRDHTNTM